MTGITVYEFDAFLPNTAGVGDTENCRTVPNEVFQWLALECVRIVADGESAWLKWTNRRGRAAVQVTSFAGVIRTPSGYQIEVLPKIGKAIEGGDVGARKLLIEMLCSMHGFRHVQTKSASLLAERMPILEVFISEFLRCASAVVRRGLSSEYVVQQGNLPALRGKLLIAQHLRANLCRADRFFTEHDHFSTDRAENRLIGAALNEVMRVTKSAENQKLGRELTFSFEGIPPSMNPELDFQKVRLHRGMGHYEGVLAWAKLILAERSPLTGSGTHDAPSLLFPMEAIFEAFVGTHLAKQLQPALHLRTQSREHHLVRHREKSWFQLKPDFLIHSDQQSLAVLDTKWKLLDSARESGSEKYGLSQGDFYQLHAYGHSYLDGAGDIVLIYPKTDSFTVPVPVFDFPKAPAMRLWVLPFCLKRRRLEFDAKIPLVKFLRGAQEDVESAPGT